MFLRKSLLGVLGIILTLGMVAFAQETQPQVPAAADGSSQQERMERRRERLRERMSRRHARAPREHGGLGRQRAGLGRLGHNLNLSDAQKEQSRAIMQRRLATTKTQREELFRLREKRIAGSFSNEDKARVEALRQEIRSSMEGVRAEMEAVLTAEQKAKLESLKAERKALHEQRIKQREERKLERRELRNKPQ